MNGGDISEEIFNTPKCGYVSNLHSPSNWRPHWRVSMLTEHFLHELSYLQVESPYHEQCYGDLRISFDTSAFITVHNVNIVCVIPIYIFSYHDKERYHGIQIFRILLTRISFLPLAYPIGLYLITLPSTLSTDCSR